MNRLDKTWEIENLKIDCDVGKLVRGILLTAALVSAAFGVKAGLNNSKGEVIAATACSVCATFGAILTHTELKRDQAYLKSLQKAKEKSL